MKDNLAAFSASKALDSSSALPSVSGDPELADRRVAVVLFSHYPADPCPRRAAEAMTSAGMSVDLICLRNERESQRETINGVNVLRLPIPKKRGGKIDYLSQYSANSDCDL